MKFEDVFYFKNSTVDEVNLFLKNCYKNLVDNDGIIYTDKVALVNYDNGVRVLVPSQSHTHRFMLISSLHLLKTKATKTNFHLFYNVPNSNKIINVLVNDELGNVLNKETYKKYMSFTELSNLITYDDEQRKTIRAMHKMAKEDILNMHDFYSLISSVCEVLDDEIVIPSFEEFVQVYEMNEIDISQKTYEEIEEENRSEIDNEYRYY